MLPLCVCMCVYVQNVCVCGFQYRRIQDIEKKGDSCYKLLSNSNVGGVVFDIDCHILVQFLYLTFKFVGMLVYPG